MKDMNVFELLGKFEFDGKSKGNNLLSITCRLPIRPERRIDVINLFNNM
jgi:hypothetical protein